ncbi:MAG TPA: AmmeMemoRadiSam system protein B [Candidatus Sulfomarinibacteraceae bacterium]|nr:AmmeMemoRadiSam system protein B [Candidatus Sulfomarinibacteraceae bacterium]
MDVRRPAVAGQFYPAEAKTLRQMVLGFLHEARGVDRDQMPCAIIAPHAGYIYSGPIAASAYAHIAAGAEKIERVVLLGPAHRAAVRGLAASSANAFATPLGEVPVDRDALEAVVNLPQVHYDDEAHAPEHGLEVHLPFLQLVLSSFRLAPLIVGVAEPSDVAQVLQLLLDDGTTLIVVSSDLSHYQSYESARRLDAATSRRIGALRDLRMDQACGQYAINGLLHVARRRGWQAQTVDLRNSGDTSGSKRQVVGYGAYVFYNSA